MTKLIRASKWVGIGVTLLILVAILAFAFAKTSRFDTIVRDFLIERLSSMGISAQVEGLDFDPVGPTLTLDTFAAKDPDAGWSATGGRVHAKLHLLRTLGGDLTLTLEAERPVVVVERRDAGKKDVSPHDVDHPIDLTPPDISIHKLKLSDASISYLDEGKALSLEVEGVNIDWKGKKLSGSIASGEFGWKGLVEKLQSFAFSGKRTLGGADIDSFHWLSDRIDIKGAGKSGFLNKLTGSFEIGVDLTDLPPGFLTELGLSPRFYPITANIAMNGSIGGSVSSPRLKGRLAISGGKFGPLDVTSVEAGFILSSERFQFDQFTVASSAGGVHGLAGYLEWSEGLWLEARGSAVAYDLREAMKLVMEGYFPVGVVASGDFWAKGPLYPKLALDCGVEELTGHGLDVSTMREGEVHQWYSLDKVTVTSSLLVGIKGIDFKQSEIEAGSLHVDVKRGHIEYREGLEYETDVTIRNLESVYRYLPDGFDAAGRAVGSFGGPYRELKFDYDFDLESSRVFDMELGTLKGRAEYDLETIQSDSIVAEGELGRIEASGNAILLPDGPYALDVTLEGGSVAKAVEFIEKFGVKKPLALAGGFSARGTLGGVVDAPVFTGQVDLEGFEIGPLGPFNGAIMEWVAVEGEFGLFNWEAKTIEARGYASLFTGSAKADTSEYRIELDTGDFALYHLETLFGIPVALGGTLEGKISSSGKYSAPLLTAKGTVTDGGIDRFDLGEMEIAFGYQGGSITLGGELAEGTATFDGVLGHGNEFTLDFTADNLPSLRLPPKVALSIGPDSLLSGEGHLAGALGEGVELSAVEWEGVLAGATFGDLTMGLVPTSVKYPHGDRGWLTASANLWEGQSLVTAELDLKGDELPHISAEFKGFDLGNLEGSLKMIGGGALTGSTKFSMGVWPPAGGVKGFLQSVDEWHAVAKVEGLSIAELEVMEITDFSGNSEGRVWYANAKLSEDAQLTAKLDIDEFTWSANLNATKLDPLLLWPRGREWGGASVSARAHATGRGGSVETAYGSGALEEVEIEGLAKNSGSWKAGWDGQGLDLTLSFDDDVNLTGRWNVESGRVVGRLEAENAQLGKWTAGTENLDGINGRVSGVADFEFGGGLPGEVQSTISALTINTADINASNDGDIELSYRGGKLEFDKVAIKGNGLELTLGGSVSRRTGWEMTADGKYSLGLLPRYVDGVEAAAGEVYATCYVSGPWDKPVYKGDMNILEAGFLKLEVLRKPIDNISLTALLNESGEFRIERLDATFGDGTIHGEGSWLMEGLKLGAISAFFETKNISYEHPKGVDYDFDGEFLVTGNIEELELRGEIRLERFLYSRRLNWRTSALKLIERKQRLETTGDATGKSGNIFVDVAVLGDHDLRLENNLGELDMTVDLRMRGYLPDPELYGRIDAKSGEVIFRGRDFKVLRSNIEFVGDDGPIAMIDARGLADVGDYTVNVSVTGPIDDIVVELSSSPVLSRTDIVSLLALGTTTENLKSGEGVGAFEATNYLTGGIQDELEGQLHTFLGFDQLHINPSYSESRQTTVPRVTVGKAISDSTYARYGAEIGSKAEQEVSLEYTFVPGVMFLGSWTDDGSESRGSFGAELRFRVTYR